MRCLSTALMLLLLLAIASPVNAGKSDEPAWAPITDADWEVGEDTARKITDAAIIFDRIRADDRKLESDRCYRTIYRRIRIFSEQGRDWAELPIMMEANRLWRGLAARTGEPGLA